MNPNSLRLVLVSLVVLLQLISLTVVSYLTSNQLDNQARQEATSILRSQADEVVEKTRLFLVPALSQLTSAGQLFSDGMLDAQRDQQLSTYFRSQLRSNLWLKGMYLAREDGSMVRVGRFGDNNTQDTRVDEDVIVTKTIRVDGDQRQVNYEQLNEKTGEMIHWQNPSDNSDPRKLHWYQNARAQNHLVWSDAFRHYVNDQPVVSASLPVYTPEGMDAGVLSVSVDLHDLTDFIERSNGDTVNSAVIMDANGRVIAYSSTRQEPAPEPLDDIHSRFRPYDEALMELFARIQTIGVNASGEDSLVDNLSTADAPQMGLSRSVNLFNGAINWTLLITQPHWSELDDSDNILSAVMRIATIIIAAPGIMALLLIIAITAPLYRLHRRATVDQLTRAYNRDEFESRLRGKIRDLHAMDESRQLISVILDLDGFKSINDNHGHPTGDLILRTVVKRLQRHAPTDSVIGRLGGDEFALFCELRKEVDPVQFMEQVRREVTASPVPSGTSFHSFGMTMGLTVIHRGESPDQVLRRADHALVKGKHVQKNRTYGSTAEAIDASPQVIELPPKPQRYEAA